jgi:ABC-type glycerol-3-phosphate transport system substrate-binding protein
MRNGLKLALAVTLGCLLTVGIAACGGGDDSTSADATSADLSGTVTVWDFEYESFPAYTEAVDQLDAEFEKEHPGVTVDRVGQPYESYEATYRAAFTAREGPDVMAMQPGESGALSFSKGLEVVNDHLSDDVLENMTQWQIVTPGLKTEGDHYGVPIGLQGIGFYYNKEMFKKAGLPTDFQPETWAELREAGEQLKKAGIQPFTGGASDGLELSLWFSLGFQSVASAEQISELAEGTLPYTDQLVTEGLEPQIEMEEAGLYPSDRFSTELFTEGFPSFAEGKGAIVLGFWENSGYWGEFNPALGEDNVGIFYPPGPTPVGTIGGFALSVPTFAKNKDAAFALIDYYGGKHANEVLFEPGGNLPVRKDVSLPKGAPVQAVELVAASNEGGSVVSPFAAMQSTVAFETLPQEVGQVMQGRTSLEDAQAAIQEGFEKSGG